MIRGHREIHAKHCLKKCANLRAFEVASAASCQPAATDVRLPGYVQNALTLYAHPPWRKQTAESARKGSQTTRSALAMHEFTFEMPVDIIRQNHYISNLFQDVYMKSPKFQILSEC
jgi:hypothetical protein